MYNNQVLRLRRVVMYNKKVLRFRIVGMYVTIWENMIIKLLGT